MLWYLQLIKLFTLNSYTNSVKFASKCTFCPPTYPNSNPISTTLRKKKPSIAHEAPLPHFNGRTNHPRRWGSQLEGNILDMVAREALHRLNIFDNILVGGRRRKDQCVPQSTSLAIVERKMKGLTSPCDHSFSGMYSPSRFFLLAFRICGLTKILTQNFLI